MGTGSLFAQHELGPAMSSQIFSRLNYNPAGIGNNENVNIFLQNRLQWAGFEGHPTYSILNIHYFNERFKSGLGGSVSYDQLGYNNTALNAKIAYAYNLDLSEKGLLSFGAAAGIDQFAKNYSDDIYDPTTDVFEDQSQVNPDFDFGVEYSMPHLLIGASINHIGMMDEITTLTPTQTYYGYIRGSIPVTKEVLIAPSLLYMNSSQSNVFDLSAVAFYQKQFWGGLHYRFGSAIGALIGFEWKFLRAGYGYEMGVGDSSNLSYNTHELMLSFTIPTKKKAPEPKAKKTTASAKKTTSKKK